MHSFDNAFDPSYLTALVDHRREEPDIEYKAWMDLSDKVVRANIARHVCALANYGGGWLVFGVDDDGSHSTPHPGDLSGYGQDAVNGIVDKYLDPAVHCSIHLAKSGATGKDYPAVRVPPHGTVPVCAKAGGPNDDKGRPQGIVKGVHYIRMAGPKSVPIDSPEMWRDVIHRCVVNEREGLLASIGRLFDRPQAEMGPSPLDLMLDEAAARWSEIIPEGFWPVDPLANKAIFAFRLIDSSGNPPVQMQFRKLKEAIRAAGNAAHEDVYEGMNFFLPPSVGMQVHPVGEVDGYEATAFKMEGHSVHTPFLWRASADGAGFEVRLHAEDSEWVASAVNNRRSRKWIPGANLSPTIQARRMYQFVAFVRAFSKNFPDAVAAELAADFSGLVGRQVDETNDFVSLGSVSAVPARRTKVTTSLSALSGDGAAEAATELVAPVFRLFNGVEITSAFVLSLGRG